MLTRIIPVSGKNFRLSGLDSGGNLMFEHGFGNRSSVRGAAQILEEILIRANTIYHLHMQNNLIHLAFDAFDN
jgi:hypothetical protein